MDSPHRHAALPGRRHHVDDADVHAGGEVPSAADNGTIFRVIVTARVGCVAVPASSAVASIGVASSTGVASSAIASAPTVDSSSAACGCRAASSDAVASAPVVDPTGAASASRVASGTVAV